MRNFWALPAVLRIALASPHSFSVFDDLLAHPQYDVIFPADPIIEHDASSLLQHGAAQPTPSGTANSQEIQDLYKPNKHAPLPASNDAILEETYEAVVLDGQRYLCSIPVIPDAEPQNKIASAEEAKAEEEKELMRATDRGWELLEGMQGNCIYYLSGWWSYSFCYGDEVKQFHQLPPSRGVPLYPPVEDPQVKSFTLGTYGEKKEAKKGKKKQPQKTLGKEEGTKEAVDDEGNPVPKDDTSASSGVELAKLETKGSSRYMVQRLAGGTECDLTGRERKIEVQFHCHPQSGDKISMIKETSTCSYLMIIYTPRLCNDVAFLPPQDDLAHPITCRPVIPDADMDSWILARLDSKTKEAERLMALENDNPLREMQEGAEGNSKRRPIIGGIEVGAKALVGSEGKVIEKGVVVGGGKEVFIGTVASSDGKQMSKEKMKELKTDPQDVEKLKQNLRQLAGRKRWKLDLVDTPRGREFRGILEADDEEEEGQAGSKDGQNSGEDTSRHATDGDQGEEEPQEGSEEVYKDEL